MSNVLRGQAGGWIADENRALPNHPLDSVLQVKQLANECYEGKEYVVDEASWRLTEVPVLDGEEEDMAFPVSISHPIRVMFSLYKNRWMLESELPSNSSRQPSILVV